MVWLTSPFKVTLRYTHIGHGHQVEHPEKFSPTEILLDSVLKEFNEEYNRILGRYYVSEPEKFDEEMDKLIDRTIRRLRSLGFNAFRSPVDREGVCCRG